MSIKTSSRTLVATFVVASLTASPALASGGPMDLRSPDAKDAAAPPAAVLVEPHSPDAKDAAAPPAAVLVEPRSPDAKDAAAPPAAVLVEPRSPDAKDAAARGAADLRVAASLAGPPPAAKTPVPGAPVFPTSTGPMHRPAAPVSAPSAGDGFDVGDAFVGAGGAAVLLVSVAGGLALRRRRRTAPAA